MAKFDHGSDSPLDSGVGALSPGGSFFTPDVGYITGGGDIEVGLLHQLQGHVVQLAVARADAISHNDNVIAEIARAARAAFDAPFGGDAADENRFYIPAAQHEIEVGADEAVRPALLKDHILRLGF